MTDSSREPTKYDNRQSLGAWCKDAGPIGPGLWLFDNLVHELASTDDKPATQTAAPDYNENDASLGVMLAVILGLPLVLVAMLILFFPKA